MPRIYQSDNSPIDFCRKCWIDDEDEAREEWAGTGEGPDGRGDCFEHDADHPEYEDWPGEYRCEDCGKELKARDNWA